MIVSESFGRDGSFSVWHGAHAGLGTLPVLLFGTEEQKQKYLPRLSSGEMIGACCLTEPHAGSDVRAARTSAKLNQAGTHYLLNGEKSWSTNAGKAHLFTVFAKLDGERFTAFLVERGFPGVTIGAEENKMGIRGSSTCSVFLDNVPVPVENMLGEEVRCNTIAFDILNIGRLKLGASCVGSAKDILANSLKYASEREAFGRPIAEFGMIRHKLAEMAVRIHAAESVSYRVAGLIQESGQSLPESLKSFAIECSIVKVHASEMLDYVADEGVQIHGGYGFHTHYPVERAYRDARVNRIFEGTNEINRMLIARMLLKRAQRGQLPLAKVAKAVMAEVLSGIAFGGMVAQARKIALFLLAVAFQRFSTTLDQEQEVLAAIADVSIEVFAMESVELRGQADYRDVYLSDGMARVETFARTVLANCSEGDELRTNMAILRRIARYEPVDAIAIRRRIAGRLLDTGGYFA